MTKVLLTNSMGPYELGWGEDMSDLFSARLTRGQGPFTLKSFFHSFGLHLIAENLPVPVRILEWPSEELFRKELSRGYDYVGIQVVSIHVPKIARMVKLIRDISPASKVVLGGYGLLAVWDPPPHDPEKHARYLLENTDYICREEGVGFFRKLVGADPKAPISQKHQPLILSSLRGMDHLRLFPSTSTLVSLGCPNACEFCNTSAFFRFKKTTVATPEQTLESLKAAQEKVGDDPTLFNMLWDEDFLLDKKYVMRLGELLREQGLVGKINLAGFASIRAISQYTPQELVECGIGSLWIGVESKFDDCVTSVHNFGKRAGKGVARVFDELHEHGITIIGSNIVGLDFHDEKNIEEDIDFFVSLKPDFYQVSPLTPCPGTVLYDRMREEGRLHGHFSYEHVQLWSDGIYSHGRLADGDIRKYFDLCHKKLYETNGPSVLNIMDVNLRGLRNMMHSPNPYFQARALSFHDQLRNSGVLLYGLEKMAPSEAVRERARDVKKRYVKYLGELPFFERTVVSRLVHRRLKKNAALLEAEKDKKQGKYSDPPPFEITQHPGNGGAPVVVARGNPVEHFVKEKTRAMAKKTMIRPKPFIRIRLADIDDFPVSFRSMEIEGDLINYVDEGKGPVILMLHGNPTWSYLYRHIIRGLSDSCRCVAPDFLGYGLSDKPTDGDYSMEAHIRRLGAFIENLNLRDITLVCQDWGGIIGLSYASRNRELFRRLVPMNTAAFLPRSLADLRRMGRARAFPFLWSFKLPILGRKMGIDWNIFLRAGMFMGIHNRKRQLHKKAWLGYLYPFQRKQDRTAILKSVRQVPMGPFAPVRRLLSDTERRIRGWDVRTRVIWGMRDPVFVPWFVERFEELLPNHAPSLKIPTASHFLQDDEPDIIIKGLRDFLKEDGNLSRRSAA